MTRTPKGKINLGEVEPEALFAQPIPPLWKNAKHQIYANGYKDVAFP